MFEEQCGKVRRKEVKIEFKKIHGITDKLHMGQTNSRLLNRNGQKKEEEEGKTSIRS